MKKILLFAVLLLGATFAQAQDAPGIAEKLAKQEMKEIVRVLTKADNGIALSTNQTVKLEKVLLDKNNAVATLRAKDLPKGEFVEAYSKLDKDWSSRIDEVLSTEQKMILQKHKNRMMR